MAFGRGAVRLAADMAVASVATDVPRVQRENNR